MEPPAGSLEPLEYIRQYLRAEGFYAAEEALVSEIENRCPEGSSPTSSTQDLHKAALAGEYHQRNPPFAKGISEQQSRQDSRSLPGYCFRSRSQTSLPHSSDETHNISFWSNIALQGARQLEGLRS